VANESESTRCLASSVAWLTRLPGFLATPTLRCQGCARWVVFTLALFIHI
jgi:hypothetical protein